MKVPLFDIKEQNKAIEPELKEAFERVLHSGHFILGPKVEHFEKVMANYLNVPHAIGVSSGTDAILLPLMVLGIGPGDEVICPAFTFFATAGCVHRLGATPVFADIDPTSFNIDPKDIEKKITSKTKAIIPVHLYGQTADMDPILKIANKNGIAIIEDAAQSLGAQYKGKKAGALGTFGAFSFFPTKNLGCMGDGGLVTVLDDELAEKARMLRVHGSKPKYYHTYVGGNFRIDALQAALLETKFKNYPKYLAKRKENATYYTNHLKTIPGIGDISNDNPQKLSILLPESMPFNTHIWNQYTVRVLHNKRDELRQFLQEEGIGSEVYYPLSLHEQACFAYLGKQDLPFSTQMSKEVLSLPIFPELKQEQLDYVVKTISKFLS